MNDHNHPEANEHELLASALVDGVADPTSAARVSASPPLTATVQAFTVVRETLRTPLGVDAATRDAALTVALAEYDRVVAEQAGANGPGAAGSGGGAVVDIASRRRWPARLAAAAAAVVVVGLIGVAAFGRIRDSDDVALDQQATPERIEVSSDDAATDGGAGQDDAEADEYVAPTIGAINTPAEVVIAVNSPEQLRDLVEAKLAPTASGSIADDGGVGGEVLVAGAAALQCLGEEQIFVAAIVYAGTPAIAVRDTVTGVTQAIDEQCNVLAEVAP